MSRAELKRFRTIDGDTVGQIAAEFNHLNIIQHLHEIEPTLLQERNDQGKFLIGWYRYQIRGSQKWYRIYDGWCRMQKRKD